jgi:hypothetical protein
LLTGLWQRDEVRADREAVAEAMVGVEGLALTCGGAAGTRRGHRGVPRPRRAVPVERTRVDGGKVDRDQDEEERGDQADEAAA